MNYEEKYLELRSKYIDFINSFDELPGKERWDSYRTNANKNRNNRDYIPEILLQEFRNYIDLPYFQKYPFLKRYNNYYQEYQEYISNNTVEEIILRKGVQGIRMTLINIDEAELYFPNVKIIYSVHSALHSLAMLLKVLHTEEFKGNEIMLYEEPQLYHPGDREYVMYIAEMLKLPLVILSRNENASFHLEVNGLPKKFGRYCTKTYKIAPAKIFYSKYFIPLMEKIRCCFTKKQLIRFMNDNNIEYPKSLKYQKKEEISDYIISKIEKAPSLIPEKTTQFQDFEFFGERADNVIQLIGINKHQSESRAKKNPHVIPTKFSCNRKGMRIYEVMPLFHETFEEMEKLVEDSGLIRNPYEIEYKTLPQYENQKKEVRMGCIICPFKTIDYYAFLKENFLGRYFLAHFLRLIGSVRNLAQGKSEYYYYDEHDCPKKRWDLLNIM